MLSSSSSRLSVSIVHRTMMHLDWVEPLSEASRELYRCSSTLKFETPKMGVRLFKNVSKRSGKSGDIRRATIVEP